MRYTLQLKTLHSLMHSIWRCICTPAVMVALLIITSIWGFTAYRLQADYSQNRQQLAADAVNIAKAFEQSVADAVNQLDLLLKIIRDLKEKNYDARSWATIVNPAYTSQTVAIQLAVIDSEGYTITTTNTTAAKNNGLIGNHYEAIEADNRINRTKTLNFSDREHFKVHVHSQADDLFISKPVTGRGTRQKTLQLTRKFLNPDGSFGGVLVASLDPTKLVHIYNGLDLGEGGGVALLGDDDVFRAGTGVFEGRIGLAFTEPQSIGEIQVQHYAVSALTHTVDQQKLNGLTHLVAMRRVEGRPLSVMVAVTNDLNNRMWNHNSLTYLGFSGFGTLVVLGAMVATLRSHNISARSLQQRNEMEIAKKVAESSAADRSMFLAVMSHEIRTPLNGVLGALDLIRHETLSDRGRRCVKMATEAGESLLGLINDVLLFSKSEFNAIDIAREPFVLATLIGSVHECMLPLSVKGHNLLTIELCAEASHTVVGDAGRLRQVLVNLVGNACKFTSGGRITLRVEARAGTGDGLAARISVTDTGIGIPADKQKQIFNRFETLDPSYSRRTDGTGLGLAICDKLVCAMGGEIHLDSHVGRGSCFSFDLIMPYAQDDVTRKLVAASVTDEPPEANKRLRILLAEDNATNAYVAGEILSDAGHEVSVATDGQKAIDMSVAMKFDLILMDISMPNVDGLQAAKAIRSSDSVNRDTRIIALTAHVMEADNNDLREAGMNGYLSKPIRKNILLDAVASSSNGAAPTAARKVQSDTLHSVIEIQTFREFVSDRAIDRVRKTLSIFVAELLQKTTDLETIISSRDVHALEMLAHSSLGSGSMVGAARMVSLSRTIEARCQRGEEIDWLSVETLLATMRETITAFAELGTTGAIETLMAREAIAA